MFGYVQDDPSFLKTLTCNLYHSIALSLLLSYYQSLMNLMHFLLELFLSYSGFKNQFVDLRLQEKLSGIESNIMTTTTYK